MKMNVVVGDRLNQADVGGVRVRGVKRWLVWRS
jgi:hypothetical protein